MRIDPAARAHMLDLGLVVDQAVIDLETRKLRRAEAVLAELTDPEALAAEQAAEQAARAALAEAEAAAATARKAWLNANGARKQREDRIKTYRAEVARAEAAIRSAESVREKERGQRDELVGV